MTILGIDPSSPLLTPREAKMLRAMTDKWQQYVDRGEALKAHGLGAALLIAWRAITQPDVDIVLPDTQRGDL